MKSLLEKAKPTCAQLFAAAALTLAAAAGVQAAGTSAPVHVAIQVDESDPVKMTMALNNVKNIHRYYAEQGEEVDIEVVTFGPGVTMLRKDLSPVGAQIAHMSETIDHLSFSACANTIAAVEKTTGKPVKLLPEAQVVPSGVVRLMELQNQGYSYLRP